MNELVIKEYNKWLNSKALTNADKRELLSIKDDEEAINDAFYQNLSFGTAGLRGVLGLGTNRMNEYVVKKATQGLANYLNKTYKDNISVIICYDSRNFSKEFAYIASKVLSSNNITAYLFDRLLPTPVCSYTVRKMSAQAGIMITASHNPKQYNGYKVYGPDGCQITELVADAVSNEINSIDIFDDIKFDNVDLIKNVPEEVYESFLQSTIKESKLDESISRDIKIIYTPLNGTGRYPVQDILALDGFKDVVVVKEQEEPDGNFTTCPYPNPEIKEALKLGVQALNKENGDILIATDPDCDRLGLVTKDSKGVHYYTGNETGLLLLDYIYSSLKERDQLPANPVVVKTIVSSDLVNIIARELKFDVFEVLTGFKYIGESIARLEKENRPNDFLLGFEESCGYLTNKDVRDKDAVNSSMLIAEAAAYNKAHGKTLFKRLNEIYDTYGRFLTISNSYEFDGEIGKNKISSIMSYLRDNEVDFQMEGDTRKNDYQLSTSTYKGEVSKIDLPKSNVIKYVFSSGTTLTVRPSGTEPKIKVYYCSNSEEEIAKLKAIIETIIQ